MKKLSLIFALAFFALALLASQVFAQTSVIINPVRWDESTIVYSNQVVMFETRWGACFRGAVQAYLGANSIELYLDGSPLLASRAEYDQYWGPIETQPAGPGASACVGLTPENIWIAHWLYEYGTLPAGDHTIRFINQVDHPIIDGSDYDGDGRPDLFTGVINDVTKTIHVIDPPP